MSYLDFLDIAIFVCVLFISIIGHEIMHGLSALYYKDTSAKDEGRLSINPVRHIDILGSILIPASMIIMKMPFLFGWAKPVNVNIDTVITNGGYKAAIIVALSGIFYNFCLLIIALIFLKTIDVYFLGKYLYTFLIYTVIINTVLIIFNSIPVPPLDGSKALEYLCLQFNISCVSKFYRKIERFGLFIILIIVIMPREFNIVLITVNYLLEGLL